MTTFGEYANAVYLGCTPFMALEYLEKHADARSVKHWDVRVLENKLAAFGLGCFSSREILRIPSTFPRRVLRRGGNWTK